MKSLDDFPALKALHELNNSPTLRAIRSLEDSPAIKAIRQLEDSPAIRVIRQIEDSPVMRAMHELEDSPTLKAMQQLEKSSAMEAIRKLENSPALRTIRALENSSTVRVLSDVVARLSYSFGPLTFSEAYKEILRRHEMASASGEADSIDTLVDEVQDRATRAPSGPLSAEFYLNFIFAFIVFCLSQISASDSEQRIIDRVNKLESTINQHIENLQDYKRYSQLYVVERPLNLRSGPSTDHEVIEILPKNLKVIELERSPGWIRIEYFDYVENHKKVGWVCSRYLIAITYDIEPKDMP